MGCGPILRNMGSRRRGTSARSADGSSSTFDDGICHQRRCADADVQGAFQRSVVGKQSKEKRSLAPGQSCCPRSVRVPIASPAVWHHGPRDASVCREGSRCRRVTRDNQCVDHASSRASTRNCIVDDRSAVCDVSRAIRESLQRVLGSEHSLLEMAVRACSALGNGIRGRAAGAPWRDYRDGSAQSLPILHRNRSSSQWGGSRSDIKHSVQGTLLAEMLRERSKEVFQLPLRAIVDPDIVDANDE